MSSIGERSSTSLLEKQREEYVLHNKKFMTRVYPSSIRVNSSNYDPISHWLVGCQMVALNFQTFGNDHVMVVGWHLFTILYFH